MNLFDALLDDIKDFSQTARTQGLGNAVNRASKKLTGKPITHPWIDKYQGDTNMYRGEVEASEDGTQMLQEISRGIVEVTNFTDTTALDDGTLMPSGDQNGKLKILDPKQFDFSGGTSSIKYTDKDDLLDIAFAGRPGSLDKFGESVEVGSGDPDSWGGITGGEKENAMWLTAKDGGGLSMQADGGEKGLSHLQKIFDLDDYDMSLSELIASDVSDEMFSQGSYNLVLAEGAEVMAVVQVDGYGQKLTLDKTNLKNILGALDKLGATDIYHLDAGMNDTWQMDKKRKDSYDFDYADTIRGTYRGK